MAITSPNILFSPRQSLSARYKVQSIRCKRNHILPLLTSSLNPFRHDSGLIYHAPIILPGCSGSIVNFLFLTFSLNRPTGPIYSLSCNVCESFFCVFVCAIKENPLSGGCRLLVKACIANTGKPLKIIYIFSCVFKK